MRTVSCQRSVNAKAMTKEVRTHRTCFGALGLINPLASLWDSEGKITRSKEKWDSWDWTNVSVDNACASMVVFLGSLQRASSQEKHCTHFFSLSLSLCRISECRSSRCSGTEAPACKVHGFVQ